ncbi:MAG: phospholipase D-like domain-containing protein [Deltaproteobacteria bacterium]
MKLFLLRFTVLFFAISERGIAVEVYFSPSPDCENRIVKALSETQKEVKIAIYSLNNRKIVEALRQTKKRGISIQILTDATQASQKSSLVIPLIQEGFDLKVHSKFKIEHNKFAVFDSSLVSTGSFNWTGPASRSNSENCIFLTEADVIRKYQERFRFLWETNTLQASSVKVKKLMRRSRQLSGH